MAVMVPFFVLASVIIPAQEDSEYPKLSGGAAFTDSMKVENDGSVSNLFDELEFRGEAVLSPYSSFFARIEVGELMGYNAGWTDGPAGEMFFDDGFERTRVYIESDVLQEAGLDPSATLNLLLGYGGHQEAMVVDYTGYRFERSSTSGIDGFDISTTVSFDNRFHLTAAFNPASFESTPYPDVFGAFEMEMDLSEISLGKLIHLESSAMQLLYDSSANLENNRLYYDLDLGDAMSVGIGGDLVLDFAGMGIYGFGMAEFMIMYDRNKTDIFQAEWCAGFDIPALSGIQANLSGNNAIFMGNGGDGNYMNIGLDVRAMMTDIFGIFGAGAAIGIMDIPGASFEGGVCLVFDYFEIYTGYSDHALWTDPKYAKGAFDKTEVKYDGTDYSALGGGFFLTFKASF